MPTRVTIKIGRDRHHKSRRHNDTERSDLRHEPEGWAPERPPLNEKPIANLNMKLGQWLARAEANSGPKIAPGTGTKKSS